MGMWVKNDWIGGIRVMMWMGLDVMVWIDFSGWFGR